MLQRAAGDGSEALSLKLLNGRDGGRDGGGKSAGVLYLRRFHIDKNPSFLDYIAGGTQVA